MPLSLNIFHSDSTSSLLTRRSFEDLCNSWCIESGPFTGLEKFVFSCRCYELLKYRTRSGTSVINVAPEKSRFYTKYQVGQAVKITKCRAEEKMVSRAD